MKEILTALFPVACFILGIFLGKMSGRLESQIIYLRRISAAFKELKRLPCENEKQFLYRQGYFHGVVHISEGRPPDNLNVEALIAELD